MHQNKEDFSVRHIPNGQRFELDLDDNKKAIVVYKERDGKLYLTYSEVPSNLRGHGIGKKLVEETFEIIRNKGLKAVAVCSYIKAVAQRNPEFHDVIEF